MPITPYHFGPGLLLKGIAPRAISLTAFAVANVVIDVESVVNLLAGRYPVHATLHTFGAALAVGSLSGGGVALLGQALKARSTEWGWRPSLVGGVLGGFSQPLLDGVMHADIRPLLPFTNANPLLHVVDLHTLHLVCVLTGGVGMLVLGWRRWRPLART